jgi:hypothetical protein
VPIFFLVVQYPVFQQGDKNILATVNLQETSFLQDYAISFVILMSLPQPVLFLIVFFYTVSFILSFSETLTVAAETPLQMLLLFLGTQRPLSLVDKII